MCCLAALDGAEPDRLAGGELVSIDDMNDEFSEEFSEAMFSPEEKKENGRGLLE